MGFKFENKFKQTFGMTPQDLVVKFNEKLRGMHEMKAQQKFAYNVEGLEDWTDTTAPVVMADLVQNSTFLASLSWEDGVKNSKNIELLNAEISLREKEGCDRSTDGSVIFTNVEIKTSLLEAGIDFCNEDLNKKWTAILNVVGVRSQNGQLPAPIEDILMAYLMKLVEQKSQKLMLAGDTTSVVPNMNIFNGQIKLIDTNADVVEVDTAETQIDETNAYDLAKKVALSASNELLDSGMPFEIRTDRTTAQNILLQWNEDHPHSQVDIPNNSGVMTFNLPILGTKVTTYPEYSNALPTARKMHLVPTGLCFGATDDMNDLQLEIFYDEFNDKLRVYTAFRLGTQIVWGKYFSKLVLDA